MDEYDENLAKLKDCNTSFHLGIKLLREKFLSIIKERHC